MAKWTKCAKSSLLIGAQRKALEELERANEATNPILSWVMSGDHQLAPWRALTHELSVPSELDMIVEALLGSNMHGLFVQDRESVRTFIDALEQSGETGDVVLLPEKDIFQLASSDDFCNERARPPPARPDRGFEYV